MPLIKCSDVYAKCHGAIDEHNDCAVRAASLAANVPYQDVHKLFEAKGRIRHRGTKWETLRQAVTELGGTLATQAMAVRYSVQRQTLAAWLRDHPRGRYLVCRSGHAFAVIDGVVHDWSTGTGARSRIVMAYRFPNGQAD